MLVYFLLMFSITLYSFVWACLCVCVCVCSLCACHSTRGDHSWRNGSLLYHVNYGTWSQVICFFVCWWQGLPSLELALQARLTSVSQKYVSSASRVLEIKGACATISVCLECYWTHHILKVSNCPPWVRSKLYGITFMNNYFIKNCRK